MKMKQLFKYQKTVIVGLLASICMACGDKSVEPQRETSEVDVYLAGVEKGQLQATVKVWTNGKAQTIMSTDLTMTEVVDMVVENGKVYVATSDAAGRGAHYWADGKSVELTSQFEKRVWATGIAVRGDDVYVSGYVEGKNRDRHLAVYWKNGVEHLLSEEHLLYQYYARTIAIINGEILIAGEARSEPVIWNESGVATPLEFDGETMNAAHYYMGAMLQSGSDVYVHGDVVNIFTGYRVMLYWKNGTAYYPIIRAHQTNLSKDLFVKGNDVYIAGQVGFYDHAEGGSKINPAVYWKNGEMVLIGQPSQHGVAHAITVTSNDDIYAAGWEGSRAALWINGQKQNISVGNNSVFQAMVLVE